MEIKKDHPKTLFENVQKVLKERNTEKAPHELKTGFAEYNNVRKAFKHSNPISITDDANEEKSIDDSDSHLEHITSIDLINDSRVARKSMVASESD